MTEDGVNDGAATGEGQTTPTPDAQTLWDGQPQGSVSDLAGEYEPWTDEQKAEWGASLDPPETVGGYRLSELLDGHLAYEHEQVPFEGLKAMADAMQTANLSPTVGHMIYEAGLAAYVANGSKPLDDAAIEQGATQGRMALERKHGRDVAVKIINEARSLIALAADKNPAVLDWLEESGVGNNPLVIEALARHAMALRARGDWRRG